MLEKTSFIIEKIINISLNEEISLNNLYQPIIGPVATAIYKFFDNYHTLIFSKKISNRIITTISFDELINNLSISMDDVNKNIKKLEGIGLIKTYEHANNKTFIYQLIEPLSPTKFSKNKILRNYVISKIGEQVFERTVSQCRNVIENKEEFKEVTTKFQDVFGDELVNDAFIESQQNTLELKISNFSTPSEAIEKSVPFQFINYLTKKTASPSLIRIINNLQLTGFDNKAINVIIHYSFEVNNKIVGNYINKIAKDFYFKNIFDYKEIKEELENAKNNKGMLTNIKTSASKSKDKKISIFELSEVEEEKNDWEKRIKIFEDF